MIHTIVFDDEITLWWKYDVFLNATEYKLYLDGEFMGLTTKTRYSFFDLQAERKYEIRIEAYEDERLIGQETVCVETPMKKRRIDVTKAPYFAKGDGVTLNTAALQRALNDCKKDERVYLPKGVYLTGALTMHGDSELYVDSDAVLQGTGEVKDYAPKIKSRFEGKEMMCYQSLINIGVLDNKGGYNCKNVVIRGKGVIYGGGAPLAKAIIASENHRLRDFLRANQEYVNSCEHKNTIAGRARGRLIQMCNAENVVICGLMLGFGPSWNIHFIYCKNIVTYNCVIQSDKIFDGRGNMQLENVWNGDGWDPDSSEDCTLFNTILNTADDGVAIKSGKNPEGNQINRPSKNICVFDCYGKNGVAVGSEISGGVDGVYIWDCVFLNSVRTINIKTTVKRGGYVKNFFVYNCNLRSFAIRTQLGYNNDGESAGYLTKIQNVCLEKVRFKSPDSMLFDASPFKDIPIVSLEGFDGEENYVDGVVFKDVSMERTGDKIKDTVYAVNVKNCCLDVTEIK